MNYPPLTMKTLSDATSYKPLSASELLTVRSKLVLPPAEKIQKEDFYTRFLYLSLQHLDTVRKDFEQILYIYIMFR